MRGVNRAGLAVHGWICVFPEGKDSALLAAHPEYTAQPGPERPRGEAVHGLACPNRPEVQDYEAGLYRELMDCPIAGVSLDYIRYVDGTCYRFAARITAGRRAEISTSSGFSNGIPRPRRIWTSG